MGRSGQVYLLDAIAAIVLLLTVCILICTVLRVHLTRVYTPPEGVLGVMARDPRFVEAVYREDVRVLESIVKSYVGGMPYNLTVYADGRKVLSIGGEVEGVSAVIQLTGYGGRVEERLVCLVVGGG